MQARHYIIPERPPLRKLSCQCFPPVRAISVLIRASSTNKHATGCAALSSRLHPPKSELLLLLLVPWTSSTLGARHDMTRRSHTLVCYCILAAIRSEVVDKLVLSRQSFYKPNNVWCRQSMATSI